MAAFNLSASATTVAPGVGTTITVTMTPQLNQLQTFDYDDGAGGGVFTPATPMVMGVQLASKSVNYRNSSPGVYTLTFAPNGGQLAAEPPQSILITVTGAGTGGGAGGHGLRLRSSNGMGVGL